MKTIILIVLVLLSVGATAQTHLAGVTGGVTRANVVSGRFLDSTDPVYRISGGVTYELLLKKISFGADIVYAQHGFAEEFESLPGDSDEFTYRYHYDYLSIPIKVGYTNFNRGNGTFGFIKAGVIPSLLMNAKTEIPRLNEDAEIIGERTVDVTDEVSAFDLAGHVEIGGGHKITNKLWVTLSFAYRHSITSIANARYFGNAGIRHNGFGAYLGLRRVLNN